MGVRYSLSELVRDWSSQKGIMHDGWKQWAKKKKKKDNNIFVSENFQNQREGLPLQHYREVGSLKLNALTTEAELSGEIRCQYAIAGESSGKHIYFFIKKQLLGIAASVIVMHDGGADPDITFYDRRA